MFDLGEVEQEILAPQAGAFADGRRLGRLEVGEPERREVAVAMGETRHRLDHTDEAVADQAQPFFHQQEVRVVRDEAARRPEVDDATRRGGRVAVGVDVRHHVVPHLALVLRRCVEVDIVGMNAHLGEDIGANASDRVVIAGHAEFGLGLGEGDPEPTPGRKLPPGAPQALHRVAAIPPHQGILEHVQGIHDLTSSPSARPAVRRAPLQLLGDSGFLSRIVPTVAARGDFRLYALDVR